MVLSHKRNSLLLVAIASATLVYVTADNNIYRDDTLRINSDVARQC